MGDLTANFSSKEFECKHCDQLVLSPLVPNALQAMRERAGKPITINSGYRCPIHNKAVGGAPMSKHLKGIAVDFKIAGYSVFEMAALAESSLDFRNGGIGIYPEQGFVHADVRSGPLRWIQLKGKYYYF